MFHRTDCPVAGTCLPVYTHHGEIGLWDLSDASMLRFPDQISQCFEQMLRFHRLCEMRVHADLQRSDANIGMRGDPISTEDPVRQMAEQKVAQDAQHTSETTVGTASFAASPPGPTFKERKLGVPTALTIYHSLIKVARKTEPPHGSYPVQYRELPAETLPRRIELLLGSRRGLRRGLLLSAAPAMLSAMRNPDFFADLKEIHKATA